MTDERPSGWPDESRVPESLRRFGWFPVGFGAFLAVYAYLLGGIAVGELYAFGDFPPYVGQSALDMFLSTWHFQQLGYSHQYTSLAAYVGVVTIALGRLGQSLFYIALVPAAFLTFAVFAKRFVDGPSLYIAAGVYALNPVTIGEFVNGGANEFLSLVGAPLIVHYLWEVTENDSWHDSLKAGAVFGATAIIPWTAFWSILPFAAYLLYRARTSVRTVAKLAVAGAVGVVLSAPSTYYILQRSQDIGSPDALYNHVAWNYADATLFNLLRLAGNRGTFAMGELGYNADPVMVVGLVVPAVALLAWRDERVRFLFPVVAVIVGFILLTKQTVTYPLFEAVPVLWSVRDPAKLQYPLALSLCLLFAVGLRVVFDATSDLPSPDRTKVTRVALTGVLVISLFAYVAPAAGAFGLQETRGDDYYVPQEYENVADEVDGKVLWAPYSYTTQLRLRHAYPDHVGIQSGGGIQGKGNAELVAELFHDFAADEPVAERLQTLGVQYVVVDAGSQTRYPAAEGPPRLAERHNAPWLFGDPETFNDRLSESDEYEKTAQTGSLTVYRVVDAEPVDRYEQYEGIHQLYYPTDAGATTVVGPNVVTNGDFEQNLTGWWTWGGETGTQTTIVETEDGGHAAELVTESGDTYPIAQKFAVEERQPYAVDVNATGAAVANLYWYDGEKSPENLTKLESYPLSDLPQTVTAEGDTLSLRIVPNSTTVTLRNVSVARSSYPRQTGFAANADSIPGVVVDGPRAEHDVGRVVGVNLPANASVDPDVEITDAETVLAGELVFDSSYRQGVAVEIEGDELPSAVPDDAEVVSERTDDGLVVDYWRVGSFDDTPVTVLHTSYDEKWVGPPGSKHFEAKGWANGYTNARPEEVRWTGGSGRMQVVNAWLGAWAFVLAALLAGSVYRHRRRNGTSS